jgi:hypothetical protein
MEKIRRAFCIQKPTWKIIMTDQKCPCSEHLVEDLTKNPAALMPSDNLLQAANVFQVDSTTTALQISACVSAKYDNGRICVKFPLIGDICFSVGLPIPADATVSVCMATCGSKWSPPFFKGVKATVSFNGSALWSGIIWGSC